MHKFTYLYDTVLFKNRLLWTAELYHSRLKSGIWPLDLSNVSLILLSAGPTCFRCFFYYTLTIGNDAAAILRSIAFDWKVSTNIVIFTTSTLLMLYKLIWIFIIKTKQIETILQDFIIIILGLCRDTKDNYPGTVTITNKGER